MVNGDDSNKVSALLASTQQLRTHLNGLIYNIIGFTIIANLAVWTLFLQPYITHFTQEQTWDHSYLAFASTISLVLLFLWRLYTRYLDLVIANLYPDFIYFEGKLSCPSDYGTSGFLKRELKDAGNFLQSGDLTSEQKAKVASHLVNRRLSGSRGHGITNWITLLIMVGLVWIIFSLGIFEFWHLGYGANEHGIVRPDFKLICGIIGLGALIGMIILIIVWPKKPSKEQVGKIVRDTTKTES